jgi:hypothetical protein
MPTYPDKPGANQKAIKPNTSTNQHETDKTDHSEGAAEIP